MKPSKLTYLNRNVCFEASDAPNRHNKPPIFTPQRGCQLTSAVAMRREAARRWFRRRSPRVSGRLTCVLTVRKERACWIGREGINSRSKCLSSPRAEEIERYCNQQRHCLLTERSQGGLKDSRLAVAHQSACLGWKNTPLSARG